MASIRKRLGFAAIALASCLLWFPALGMAAEAANPAVEGGAPVDCSRLAELMRQQKGETLREIGQLKREIALLREEAAKPGVKEIFAGIGYIVGLAGAGLYAHSRKERQARNTPNERKA